MHSWMIINEKNMLPLTGLVGMKYIFSTNMSSLWDSQAYLQIFVLQINLVRGDIFIEKDIIKTHVNYAFIDNC